MQIVAPEIELLNQVQRLPRLHDDELLRQRDALLYLSRTRAARALIR